MGEESGWVVMNTTKEEMIKEINRVLDEALSRHVYNIYSVVELFLDDRCKVEIYKRQHMHDKNPSRYKMWTTYYNFYVSKDEKIGVFSIEFTKFFLHEMDNDDIKNIYDILKHFWFIGVQKATAVSTVILECPRCGKQKRIHKSNYICYSTSACECGILLSRWDDRWDK